MIFYGDPILEKSTEMVKHVDNTTRALERDMFDTMQKYNGQGLSANQIGSDKAMMVLEFKGKRYTILNPIVTGRSKETNKGIEGCLSIPLYVGEVERSNKVTLNYKDGKGKLHKGVQFEGTLARIFQHEHDHLCGILFLSRIINGTMKRLSL